MRPALPVRTTSPARVARGPATRLSRVVLPQPEAPTRHTNSPVRTWSEIAVEGEDAVVPAPEPLADVRSRPPCVSPIDRRLKARGSSVVVRHGTCHLRLASGLEDLVEDGQVVDAAEVVDRLRAGRRASASSADFRSEEAIGSSVKVRFGHAAAITSGFRGLPVILSISSLATVWASAELALTYSLAATWPSRNCFTTSGWSFEELGGHHEVGGDVLALGPQVALVDQDLAAALLDQAGRPRLGHPGAVDVAGDEGLRGSGCSPAGRCSTSPPPASSVLEARAP